MKIGILTYNERHLKTEQIVHALLSKGNRDIMLIAAPYVPRAQRDVMFEHRPNQLESAQVRDLASAHELELHMWDASRRLPPCDYYIVGGAGIISRENLNGNIRILNAHPGLIPLVRGLDSFKWAIYQNQPLGVSLHYISEEVDAGKVIKFENTPIYPSDTLVSLARRHYELEITLISNFQNYLDTEEHNRHEIGHLTRRMPKSVEVHLHERFNYYMFTRFGSEFNK